MTSQDYEKALLVAASWRLATNNDVNELLAIACVLRNWVIPRFGVSAQRLPMNGPVYYESYSAAVEVFLTIYPVRPLPRITEPTLIDPYEGLLFKVDGIYDCTFNDITSSRAFPSGARYFGRVVRQTSNDWFANEVLAKQDVHPLIGTFGSQQFYV